VARPKERFAAGVTGLAQLAACYAAGIVSNRPFASGNLAASFVIPVVFLGANGLVFTGSELPVVERILALAQGKETEAEFAHYLRCNCDPVQALAG
jgi:death-on-curing protein